MMVAQFDKNGCCGASVFRSRANKNAGNESARQIFVILNFPNPKGCIAKFPVVMIFSRNGCLEMRARIFWRGKAFGSCQPNILLIKLVGYKVQLP
jgi:hypothetical protein